MELKLSRKKIKLKYDGMSCDLLVPTTKEIRDFQRDLDENKNNEAEALYNFLKKIGMHEEILDSLDIISLREVIDYISGKKNLKAT